MKKITLPLFIALFFLGAFAFTSKAHASELLTTSATSSVTCGEVGNCSSTPYYGSWSSPISGLVGTVTDVDVNVGYNGGASSGRATSIEVWNGDMTTLLTSCYLGNWDFGTSSGYSGTPFTCDNPFNAYAPATYRVRIVASGAIPHAQTRSFVGVKFYGAGAFTDSVTITSPVASSSQLDFSQWQVQYNNATAGASIKINVCPYLTSCPRYDSLPLSLGATTVTTTKTFLKSSPLHAGRWTAVAYLYHGSETLATSSIDFYIVGSVGSPTGVSTSTFAAAIDSFSATLDVDCSDYDGFSDFLNLDAWGCYLKKVFYGAIDIFIVPDAAFNDFLSDGASTFKSVFPFSIFFDIAGVAQQVADENSTVATSSLQTPELGPLPSFTILSEDTLPSAVGQSATDMYFSIIEAVLWIMTGLTMAYAVIKLF